MADQGLKPLPPAFADALIIGLGDPSRGTFIDSHQSRQNSAVLSQLARRLGGRYFDANSRQVPTLMLRGLTTEDASSAQGGTDMRAVALTVFLLGALILTFLPIALEYLGAPDVSFRREAAES